MNNEMNTANNTNTTIDLTKTVYTAKELFDMIDNGLLLYSQTTQREFVYNSEPISTDEGDMTRAGALIRSVLTKKTKIPPVIFWYNTDLDELHIHDGKQRIMSFYYFCNPGRGVTVETKINGENITWKRVKEEGRQILLNQKFTVAIEIGTSVEEEVNFSEINSHSLALTEYEMLRGSFHGTLTDTFEDHLENLSKIYDKIIPVKKDRGVLAYSLLRTHFDLWDKDYKAEQLRERIYSHMRKDRNDDFTTKCEVFDHIMRVYNSLSKMGIKTENALKLASYLVDKDFGDLQESRILNLYSDAMKEDNDINKWNLDTHNTFITKYIKENKRLCYRRFFQADLKYALVTIDHVECKCVKCNEMNIKKLALDHKVAWANGGSSYAANAQLMCTSCNSSKGDKDESELDQ